MSMSKHASGRRSQDPRSYWHRPRHAQPRPLRDGDTRVIRWAVVVTMLLALVPALFATKVPSDSPMVAPAAVVSDVGCGLPPVEELTERATTVRTVGWVR